MYTMLITNNHNSFHLQGKKNLVRRQKVSKYYGQDCLKYFLLHFMSSLRAAIFENCHFAAEIYFIFLKTHPRSNFKCFQCQIWTSVKRLEKQLLSKTNFINSLQISYSNSRTSSNSRSSYSKTMSKALELPKL